MLGIQTCCYSGGQPSRSYSSPTLSILDLLPVCLTRSTRTSSTIPARSESQTRQQASTSEEHRAARSYCVVFCQRPKLEDYTNVISNVLGPCQKANGNQLLQPKLQLLTLVYSIGNNGPLTGWFYSSSSLDPVGLTSNWTHKEMCYSLLPFPVNRLLLIRTITVSGVLI